MYKAKRVDIGEWAEGFYFLVIHNDKERHCIGTATYLTDDLDKQYSNCSYEIDPNTLREGINKRDKNGVNIYGGDTVKTKYGRLCKVLWSEERMGWDLVPIDTQENVNTKAPDTYDMWYNYNIEVVG